MNDDQHAQKNQQKAENFQKNFKIGVKMGMEDAKKENDAKELKEKEAKK